MMKRFFLILSIISALSCCMVHAMDPQEAGNSENLTASETLRVDNNSVAHNVVVSDDEVQAPLGLTDICLVCTMLGIKLHKNPDAAIFAVAALTIAFSRCVLDQVCAHP